MKRIAINYLNVILFSFLLLSSLLLFSCGNNEKDVRNTVKYLNMASEFVASGEYSEIFMSARDLSAVRDSSGKYYLDEKKYRSIYNAAMSEKFDSIAVLCGFRDFREADSYVIEFREDSEVKSLLDKYVQELKNRHDEIEKEVKSSIR